MQLAWENKVQTSIIMHPKPTPVSALRFNWWLRFSTCRHTHANTCLDRESATVVRIKVISGSADMCHLLCRTTQRHVVDKLNCILEIYMCVCVCVCVWNMWLICNANSKSLWSPGVHHRQQAQLHEHGSQCWRFHFVCCLPLSLSLKGLHF